MPLVVVYSDRDHHRARLCRLLRPRIAAILAPVATPQDLTLTAALETISAIVVPATADPDGLRQLLDEPALREIPAVIVADEAAARHFADRPYHFLLPTDASIEEMIAMLEVAVAYESAPATSRRFRRPNVHRTFDGGAGTQSLDPLSSANDEPRGASTHRTHPVGPAEAQEDASERDAEPERERIEAYRATPASAPTPPPSLPPRHLVNYRPTTGAPDRRPPAPLREHDIPGQSSAEHTEPVDAHFVGARSELADWLETASRGRLRVQTHPTVEALLRTTTCPFASRYVLQLAPDEACEDALQKLRSATGLEPPRLAVLTSGPHQTRVHTRDFSSLRIFRGPFDPDEVVDFLCDGCHGPQARILTLAPPRPAASGPTAGAELARTLTTTDLMVMEAASLDHLLAAARSRRVDLIALDATRAEAAALEACRRLREACGGRDPAVVLLADQPSSALHREAFRAGADDIFLRPWPTEEVAHRAALLVERVRAWRERYAHDRLTGLHHTAVLGEHLVEALASSAEAGHWTSLLVVDVDSFGRLVDRFGADAGDAALRMVADALSLAVGPDALIFRDFRDHFYVLPRWPLPPDAQDRLRERLEALGRVTLRASDGRGFYVSATAGHILIPPGHGHADDCVRRVHRVLDTARRSRGTRLLTASIDPGGPA